MVASTLGGDPEPAWKLLEPPASVPPRDRGYVLDCVLVAQAALSCAVKRKDWRPLPPSPLPPSPKSDDLRELADLLLKKALDEMERSWTRRSYTLVRLLLTFDVRLAHGKGPDLTFYGPIRAPLERLGGEAARIRLRGALLDVAHRELIAREHIDADDLWCEVSYLVDAARRARS